MSDMPTKSEITSVPLLDLTRFDDGVAAQYEQTFKNVLHSGRYILGPEVDAFEEECAAYCGTENRLDSQSPMLTRSVAAA